MTTTTTKLGLNSKREKNRSRVAGYKYMQSGIFGIFLSSLLDRSLLCRKRYAEAAAEANLLMLNYEYSSADGVRPIAQSMCA